MISSIFFKSLSFSYLRQIVSLVIGIISIPLLLNYLGTTFFGIWTLILGLTGYLNNIAFGVPTAMSTFVAKTLHKSDQYFILKKSTQILVFIVALFILLFTITISIDTTWIAVFLGNIEISDVEIITKIFILFIYITLLKIPLNLYIQYFVGINLVYISEIYQTLNISLSFLVLLIAISFHLNIYDFALYTLLAQLFLSLCSFIHVLIKFRIVDKKRELEATVSTNEILKSGFSFFQVGLAASIVWSTDNLVISHFLSPEYITPYAIAFKMFAYIFIFSAMINGVISPMYGVAYAENNFKKINSFASTILLVLVVIGGLVWFSLLFFAKDVILIWTGDENAFGGFLLIFALGLYGYILSYVNTYATLIFSMNFANKTLVIVWAEAFLNFILSIVFINYIGIGGVALATALAALLSAFTFLPKTIKKLTDDQISFDYTFMKKHFLFLVLPMVIIGSFTGFIELFLLKLLLYILLVLIYISITWKLLTHTNKSMIIKILKRKM